MSIKREPALAAIAVLAPAVQLTCAFLVHDASLQGTINAVAALAAGLLVAAVVRSDKFVPAALGFAQGVLALALQLGFALSAEQQSCVMAFIGVAAAAWTRTQVTASAPAKFSEPKPPHVEPPTAQPFPTPFPRPTGRHERRPH